MIQFALFTLSLTAGASHGCEAYLRNMVPAVCTDPRFPAEQYACDAISPMVGIACEVRGNEMWTTSQPRPGQVLALCIYAENTGGRSDCAANVGTL